MDRERLPHQGRVEDGPAAIEDHPAYAFRLERLTLLQRRAVARAAGVWWLSRLPPRRRIHLESLLGVLLDRFTHGGDPRRVAPRVVRQIVERPDRIFRSVTDHLELSRRVFEARLAAAGEVAEEKASRLLPDAGFAPLAAAAFRLEHLTPGQRDTVDEVVRQSLGKGLVELQARERIDLEARLGVLLVAWLSRSQPPDAVVGSAEASNRAAMEAVPPQTVQRLLRKPEKVFRRASRLLRRAEALALERRLAEVGPAALPEKPFQSPEPLRLGVGEEPEPSAPDRTAARGVSSGGAAQVGEPAWRPGIEGPKPLTSMREKMAEVDPQREPGFLFRLDQLTERQRAAVARWLASRGRREATPDEVLEIECRLGVLLDRLTRGGDVRSVSPHVVSLLLEAPHRLVIGKERLGYIASLVAQERRSRRHAGEDSESEVFHVPARIRGLSPGYWAAALIGSAAGLVVDSERLLSKRPKLRVLEPARTWSRDLEADLARRSIWQVVLAFWGAHQVARLCSTLVFGQPSAQSWYESRAPLAWAWLTGAGNLERWGVAILTIALALGAPWRRSDDAPWIRRSLLAIVGVLVASVLATPPNPYFGTGFWTDRLLLVALAVGCRLHPAALPSFLVAYRLIHQQTRYPELTPYELQNYRFLEHPLQALLVAGIVFLAFRALPWLGDRIRAEVLALLLLGVLTGLYVDWGWSLLSLGPTPWAWALHNELGNVLVAGQQAGWLSTLPENVTSGLANGLDLLSPLLQVGFLVAIAAAMFAAFDRRIARVVLVVLLAAHLGYLALSGILLWGLVATLCLAILTLRRSSTPPVELALVFGPMTGLAFLVASMAFPRADYGIDFAQWDTRLSAHVRVELVDDSGRTRDLEPAWIAPYDRTLNLQIGMLGDRDIIHRGRSTSSIVMVRMRRAALSDAAFRETFGDPRAPKTGPWAPAVSTLEPFDELLRRTLTPRQAPLVELWRRQPIKAVHPLALSRAMPEAQWKEARIRRSLQLRTNSQVRLLVDDVVYVVPLVDRAAP